MYVKYWKISENFISLYNHRDILVYVKYRSEKLYPTQMLYEAISVASYEEIMSENFYPLYKDISVCKIYGSYRTKCLKMLISLAMWRH